MYTGWACTTWVGHFHSWELSLCCLRC